MAWRIKKHLTGGVLSSGYIDFKPQQVERGAKVFQGHLLGSYRKKDNYVKRVYEIRRPRRRPSNFETYCAHRWLFLSSS